VVAIVVTMTVAMVMVMMMVMMEVILMMNGTDGHRHQYYMMVYR